MEATYTHTVRTGSICTRNALERACRDFGSHYMDADTLRFFACRVLDVRPLESVDGKVRCVLLQSIQAGFRPSAGRVHKVTVFTFGPDGVEIDDLYNGLDDRSCASQSRKAGKIYKAAR